MQDRSIARQAPKDSSQPTVTAVLYARVSSKEQEQGYSIPAQQNLLRGYADDRGIQVVQEFVDVETAKTTGRPGFGEMISYLKQHPLARVLLVEKTDRLYRNFKDYLTIEDLALEIHLVKENEILSKNSRSSEKFVHAIKLVMAKNYIDNLSEEVKKGLHTKAAQGLWPSFAPLGYVNTLSPEGIRIIIPDPILGPIVTKLYVWFATGEYSLKALACKAYEEGFRFRKSQSKIPVTTLHKILRKRIYTGDFDYAGVTYHGIHEPLVPIEIWHKVQDILTGRHEKKDRKVTHDFAYSGLVRCGHCRCSLVGEVKKGRYVYYHCTGYRGKCPEPYTREEELEQQFVQALRELVIPVPVLESLQQELVKSDQNEQVVREQALRGESREMDRLQARLDLLYEDRLEGRISTAEYDQKAGATREHQQRLRHKIQSIRATDLEPTGHAVDLMALASRAADLFLGQPANEQRKLLRLVVQEAFWKDQELRMSFREPFEKLRLSNQASSRNPNDLGGNGPGFDNWRRGGDSNPRYSF